MTESKISEAEIDAGAKALRDRLQVRESASLLGVTYQIHQNESGMITRLLF